MGNQYCRKQIQWIVNESGCHICTSHAKDQTGYIRIKIKGKLDRLHRVVYRESKGKIPTGKVVMHKCDNPSCINIDHLMLGTQKENMNDCVDKNRQWKPKGCKNGRAKLTEMQVAEIIKDTRRQVDIAKEYGVTQAQISAIKLHKTWKDQDMYLNKKDVE